MRWGIKRKISAQHLWSGFERLCGTEASVFHAPTNTARMEPLGPGNALPNSWKDEAYHDRFQKLFMS